MQDFDYPYDTFEILTGSNLPSAQGFTADICRRYFGILKVYIVPPLRLLHPVLPYKSEQTGITLDILVLHSKLHSIFRTFAFSALPYLRYGNGNDNLKIFRSK